MWSLLWLAAILSRIIGNMFAVPIDSWEAAQCHLQTNAN